MQGVSYRVPQGPVVSHIGFGISVIIIIIVTWVKYWHLDALQARSIEGTFLRINIT